MLKLWFRDIAPVLICLLIAAGLASNFGWHIAALWLAFAMLLIYLYSRWQLSILANWANLPTRRELSYRFGISPAWSSVFQSLARAYRNLQNGEQAVRDELDRVKHAVNQLPDALILLDRFGHIKWVNQSALALFNLASASALNRPMHHFLRDPRFTRLLDQQYQEARVSKHQLMIQLPQKPGVSFELNLSRDQEGTQLLWFRDITEQAKLDAVKSDFIANISHEIRTPLTVVAGYAETLLDLPLSELERKQHLETILRQTKTMQNLVADLLSLSALEDEAERKPDQAVQLNSLFSEMQSEAQMLSGGRHQLSFDLRANASILGQPEEIAGALRNLVSNAIRYTPEGGQIRVSFDYYNREGRLSVEDDGTGIEPTHLPRLTERFYRVDRGRSRELGGTGLGLAIVKRIAARHEMELQISSKIGQGSRFSLIVPQTRLRFDR